MESGVRNSVYEIKLPSKVIKARNISVGKKHSDLSLETEVEDNDKTGRWDSDQAQKEEAFWVTHIFLLPNFFLCCNRNP